MERPPAVAGRDPSQAKPRQGREDEYGDDEHRRAGHDQVRLPRTDRVAQRLDADPGVPPVGNGIERPVEGRVETHVEDFDDDQQTESRSDDPGQDASSRDGQGEGQGDEDDALEREPHERTGRETTRMVRSDQGDPDEQNGADREHRGDTRSHASASRARLGGGVSVCNLRRMALRGMPVVPKPPHVAAERLAEQGKRADEGSLGQSQRQDLCGRHGQNDPLSRGDDLAPVARRQRLTHPRQQPPGCEERVACRADREDPRAARAGDVHTEDEDQESVDLSVEARAQLRRRLAASRHPSVNRIQRQRDGRECHQHRDLRGPVERVGDQRRDADGERRASKGHPIRRAEPVGAVAEDAARQCRIHDYAAGDSDDPAGSAEADGSRECGAHQHLGDDPGHREGLNRSHRASVFVHTWGRYGRHGAPVHTAASGKVRPKIVNRVRAATP
jgi:hypothetical protein